MSELEDIYYQKKNIEYLKDNFGKELWIQVSGHKKLNGADAGFWCALASMENLDYILSHSSWDSHIGTDTPGFEQRGDEVRYVDSSDSLPKMERIVHYREFYGIKENYVEIDEEFRFLNNLYHDRRTDKFYAIKDNGDCEEAARIENNKNVYINLKYLINYATAKQMALLLFFDIRTEINGTMIENNLCEISDSYNNGNLIYDIWSDNYQFSSSCYSILMGKRIILPKPVEECGYWPYDKTDKYLEFDIGIDDCGEVVSFTSNPDKLANYFGKNPEAPHYLTPVFFRKEVLQKYLSKPDIYSIEDGFLRCAGLWGLRMDNHHKEYVVVYLGDLGTDLPQDEQSHWKNYNIISERGISEVKLKRDFFGLFADAEISDLKFKAEFTKFQENWQSKFGWQLFLPLKSGDEYNFEQIHIPVVDTQQEFDNLILSLVKTIIDSLNEKEITNRLEDKTDKKTGEPLHGSISKLERWFEEINLSDYMAQIEFLRDLQDLRSSGTGHRKGRNYEKVSKKFGLDENSFADVFDLILQKTNNFIDFLNQEFLQ